MISEKGHALLTGEGGEEVVGKSGTNYLGLAVRKGAWGPNVMYVL